MRKIDPLLLVPVPVIRLYWRLRHPVDHWRMWRKWRDRPHAGDQVEDCRGRVLTVVGIDDNEDDLLLEDGSRCSWMHCCERPERKTT